MVFNIKKEELEFTGIVVAVKKEMIRLFVKTNTKYLEETFTLEVLANNCPTEEGANQSKKEDGITKKPPLDPVLIAKLREMVRLFVKTNTKKQEAVLDRGKVTGRIHCATSQARRKFDVLKNPKPIKLITIE
ncbi:hypothetical protein BV898_00125 [Hypsibius exemplaris]|uniref:Uncharacterized protein n=1 Tax=Hypsibius exemplaris TaxID=2072580 RepID=A0A1W0XES4_HYPEX|nr:hypothetical protein BV898_00125 [Hypsibius exemplaris]